MYSYILQLIGIRMYSECKSKVALEMMWFPREIESVTPKSVIINFVDFRCSYGETRELKHSVLEELKMKFQHCVKNQCQVAAGPIHMAG